MGASFGGRVFGKGVGVVPGSMFPHTADVMARDKHLDKASSPDPRFDLFRIKDLRCHVRPASEVQINRWFQIEVRADYVVMSPSDCSSVESGDRIRWVDVRANRVRIMEVVAAKDFVQNALCWRIVCKALSSNMIPVEG